MAFSPSHLLDVWYWKWFKWSNYRCPKLHDELNEPFPRPIRVQSDHEESIPPYLKPSADLRIIPTHISGNYSGCSNEIVQWCIRRTHFPDSNRQNIDPNQLGAFLAARKCAARWRIRNEYDGLQFLKATIFPRVTELLHHFEQSVGLRLQSQEDDDQGIGTRVLWVDDNGTRVIWHQLSPAAADYIFPKLAVGRDHTERVERGKREFSDVHAIVVKVLSFLLDFYRCIYVMKLMELFSELSTSTCQWCEIHYLPFRLRYDRPRSQIDSSEHYHIEASSIFPIDSIERPHMAIVADLLFDAVMSHLHPSGSGWHEPRLIRRKGEKECFLSPVSSYHGQFRVRKQVMTATRMDTSCSHIERGPFVVSLYCCFRNLGIPCVLNLFHQAWALLASRYILY
jgi:hypothetical protein